LKEENSSKVPNRTPQ